MAKEGQNLLSTPKFDGDYEHWSMLMENLLRSKEWWSLVEISYTEPARGEVLMAAQRTTLTELKLKDLKTVLQKDTAKQLWDSMKRNYQGNKRVQHAQLQALRREFEVLEMIIGETVTGYFSRVMLGANNMRNLGEDMQDVKIVEKILHTLTEKFNYIMCSIEESKDINCLSVDELQSSLVVHEQKFRRKSSSEEQALKAMVEVRRGRGERGRGRGKGFGYLDSIRDVSNLSSTQGIDHPNKHNNKHDVCIVCSSSRKEGSMLPGHYIESGIPMALQICSPQPQGSKNTSVQGNGLRPTSVTGIYTCVKTA
ncbi:uncharacterized protein LOC109845786 [Asparagus officinalis]|uniref:uncharacterized protein LOC109845786 n=1 Tax=Asparagus officinalis TaxID=4686 RepID=UPI00098E5E4C|nr:uncharacterized protein LOC109845786 [Asparagus officinalis]